MLGNEPLKDVFIRSGIKGFNKADDFGLRLSVHDKDRRTVHLDMSTVEGRLLLVGNAPKRIVVVATDQFNLAGSATSLMEFCHTIDETVATMMAYGFSK